MAGGEKKAICVILAYNCANVLESTYHRIPKESVDRIILVDDASKDETLEVARHLGIESFSHEHLGYGGNVKYSIRKGIELGAEYIVDLHGDGQYDPAAIPLALAKARGGYDLVLGSRFTDLKQPLQDNMSWARYLANIGLSAIERFVLNLPLSEFHTGFRVYSRHLAETVALESTSDDFLFGFEIIAQARFCNLKIGEVPVRCSYKEEHTSISIPRSILYAFQTFRTLALYLWAKAGFQTKLFPHEKSPRVSAALLNVDSKIIMEDAWLFQLIRKYSQFIRFVIVGSFAFAVNIASLYFFTDILGIYYIVSTVLAFFVALTVSFTLQKLWTFRDHSRDRLHIQIPSYLGMQMTNVTLNASLMYVFVEYLHVWYIFSQVIISLSLAVVIFFINRRYIFRMREQEVS